MNYLQWIQQPKIENYLDLTSTSKMLQVTSYIAYSLYNIKSELVPLLSKDQFQEILVKLCWYFYIDHLALSFLHFDAVNEM